MFSFILKLAVFPLITDCICHRFDFTWKTENPFQTLERNEKQKMKEKGEIKTSNGEQYK